MKLQRRKSKVRIRKTKTKTKYMTVQDMYKEMCLTTTDKQEILKKRVYYWSNLRYKRVIKFIVTSSTSQNPLRIKICSPVPKDFWATCTDITNVDKKKRTVSFKSLCRSPYGIFKDREKAYRDLLYRISRQIAEMDARVESIEHDKNELVRHCRSLSKRMKRDIVS